jgi:hypothetical protein
MVAFTGLQVAPLPAVGVRVGVRVAVAAAPVGVLERVRVQLGVFERVGVRVAVAVAPAGVFDLVMVRVGVDVAPVPDPEQKPWMTQALEAPSVLGACPLLLHLACHHLPA